ncbi:protein TIFY 4B isoform X1 [Ziziphus jujuba]|uniref:Protein TIFY n=1 Tax=Ziziphus jujuba TaxID=326968 RepID=A0ABM3IRK1_ZIZJJ|nr:protein TIFY 4B isoform X1 [Ziziphus jujuba]
MSAGTTSFRSILDKPLNQLTEDDISQLTREDCRKFLKEKGMRRPSWNKSQAIQQVLSLKALYEPSDDSGAGGAPRRIVVSPPPPPTNVPSRVTSNSADSGKKTSGDVQASVSVEESAPYRRKEPSKSTVEDKAIDADSRDVSPRTQCATDVPVGQMTIFYCGKVNVYDGVPPEKPYMDLQARAIMHLAASPVHSSWENPFGSPVAIRSLPWHLQTASDKGGLPPSATMSQAMQTEKTAEYAQQCWEKGNNARDPDADGPANRKVLLQRYREKRKDRGRLKIKKNVGLTSSWEVYLKDQVKTHTSNGNSSRSSTSSPPQPGLPQVLCSTADNL